MRARAGSRRGWPAGKKFPHIELLCTMLYPLVREHAGYCHGELLVLGVGACSIRVVLSRHTPLLFVHLLSAPLFAPLFLCAPASGRSYCLRSVQINCCAVIICSGLINVPALSLDSFFCSRSALSLKSLKSPL